MTPAQMPSKLKLAPTMMVIWKEVYDERMLAVDKAVIRHNPAGK
jgi:hypothetical protein